MFLIHWSPPKIPSQYFYNKIAAKSCPAHFMRFKPTAPQHRYRLTYSYARVFDDCPYTVVESQRRVYEEIQRVMASQTGGLLLSSSDGGDGSKLNSSCGASYSSAPRRSDHLEPYFHWIYSCINDVLFC